MSKSPAKPAGTDTSTVPVAKKSSLRKIALAAFAGLVLLGTGAAAGLYAGPSLLKTSHDLDEKKNTPKLVKRDPEEGIGYETTYFALPDSFTANLTGTSHYVQLSLSISTKYDENVIKNIEKHNFAIRSVVLAILGDQQETVLATVIGKEALRRELVAAINTELKKHENFGGIENVYFTAFIIQ
jgi:flagellar protein FliL